MTLTRAIAALCIPAIVGACGAVAPRGVIEAARLDPLNTPPEELELAVGVPDSIELNDGDAMVRLAFSAGGEALVDTRVPLSVERAQVDLQSKDTNGEQVYAAFLAPRHASALAAAQAEIRALREAGTTGEGTLTIAVVGGCRTGAPLETLYVSTWLSTNPSVHFVPLTRRTDVLDDLGDAGVIVPPCDG